MLNVTRRLRVTEVIKSEGAGNRATDEFPANSALLETRGEESGALNLDDPELIYLLQAWPAFPAAASQACNIDNREVCYDVMSHGSFPGGSLGDSRGNRHGIKQNLF